MSYIYNPETKKEEVVNLAKYIDVDIPISESVQKGYVYPFIEARENVRNKYQKNKHKIKFSLIKYYKRMCLKI
jgi:NurA-like 5'-3' nuclease